MTNRSLKEKFLQDIAEADGYRDTKTYLIHQAGKEPNFLQIYAIMNRNENHYDSRYEYVQTFLEIVMELQPYSKQKKEGFSDALNKYLPLIDKNEKDLNIITDKIDDNLEELKNAYNSQFGKINSYERAYLAGLETIKDVITKSQQFQMRSVYQDLKKELDE